MILCHPSSALQEPCELKDLEIDEDEVLTLLEQRPWQSSMARAILRVCKAPRANVDRSVRVARTRVTSFATFPAVRVQRVKPGGRQAVPNDASGIFRGLIAVCNGGMTLETDLDS